MATRSYTLRNLTDDKGRPLSNVWCRAYNADTSALVDTQYTDSAGSCTFATLPDNANVNVLAVWGTNAKWYYNVFAETQDIMYGVLTVDHIDATSITLSALSGDLDDIGDGATYGKLLLTDISAGHIALTTNTIASGKWYNSSGVSIDSTVGINIWGTNNALTTRATEAGPIQCYVGADGKLYAGGGSVYLDSTGLTIAGANNIILLRGGYSSYIYPNLVGDIIFAPSAATIFYNGMQASVDFLPVTNIYYDLGSSTKRWERMYGNPVLNATSAAVEGGLSSSGGANGILYVYASGAWRINDVA
uniref:Uncharacterized protein n=1 Tax=viral metagenome TaxID=1070528 RepID=A0A6M3L5J3_9ZZZZ